MQVTGSNPCNRQRTRLGAVVIRDHLELQSLSRSELIEELIYTQPFCSHTSKRVYYMLATCKEVQPSPTRAHLVGSFCRRLL